MTNCERRKGNGCVCTQTNVQEKDRGFKYKDDIGESTVPGRKPQSRCCPGLQACCHRSAAVPCVPALSTVSADPNSERKFRNTHVLTAAM